MRSFAQFVVAPPMPTFTRRYTHPVKSADRLNEANVATRA